MSDTMQEMKEELFADCSEEDIKLMGMFNTAARNAIESKSGIVKNKYQREVKGIFIDVYNILKAFDVTDPAIAHATKKLLAAGKRGHKDRKQDLMEAIESIKRAIELEDE